MAVTPALIVHVSAGSIGFLSGAIALSVRKGERLHRASGTVFFVSMLVMSATAAYLSILTQPGTFFVSILTLYLAATAWATIRRKEGNVGLYEKIALAVVLGCAAGTAISGFEAANSQTGQFEGYSSEIYYFWTLIAALAAVMDLKMVLRGGISGAQRIARHLWRMCFAYFIAAASSSAQLQKVLPATVHSVPILHVLLVLAFLPLVLMVFWLIRVRFTNWYENDARSQHRTVEPIGDARNNQLTKMEVRILET